MTESQRNHYVEEGAKPGFQKVLRHVSEKRLYVEDHFEKDDADHPVTTIKKYIKPILERNRPPLTLILKQTNIKTLNLAGLGVGDDYGVAIGACIADLGHLTELRLGDNRLTDASLVPILEGTERMKSLVLLELHENDMDKKGAEALRRLLTSPTCKLEELTLDHTDVDDAECCLLMDSLCENTTLKRLTMSNNLIGQGEALNTCQPGLTTGPEAVAKMLRINKTLLELDLSWNSIMGDSAVDLAAAVAENSTLQILNLKQNSFSEHASQELGRSLIDNKGLQVLDLSYNQVSIRGAMVLATALKVNSTIRQLILDGNSVGRLGSEHLMSALRENAASDREFKLSMLECDVTQEDETIFDSQFPTKPDFSYVPDPNNKNPPFPGYILDLETPYGFMVATSLLHLANSKEGCKFTSIKHEYMVRSGRKSRKKTVNIKLKRGEGGGTVDKMRLWRELANTVNALGNASEKLDECMESCGLKPSEKIVDYIYEKFCDKMDAEEDKIPTWNEDSCWMHVLSCVFEFTDKDGSGALNCDELLLCLAEIGVMPSREHIKQVIAEYDVDGAGEIEQDEFVAYMLQKYASSPPEDKPDLVEAKSGNVWQVPREGKLYVEFVGVPSPPTADEIGSDEGIDSLVTNIMSAKDESDRQKLFEVATRDCKIFLTAAQAQRLVDEIKHGFQKIDAVRMLLPQLSSATEAVRFVESNLDWEGKLLLRIALGQGWKPIMGMLSGHYDLDFTQGKDRTASKKLSEQATLENRFSQFESGRMDTSQRGNWENYRNGTVDGAKVGITSSFFNKAMGVGKVRFDYVCTTRPKKGTKAMGDGKFTKLLKQVGLDSGAYSEEPDFFQEHLRDGVIREYWLGWQKTTRRQFELDRAFEEKKRLELLEQMKIGKAGEKKAKKKEEEGGGTGGAGGAEGEKRAGEKSGTDELELPPEPLPPNAFTLEIGEETVVYEMPDFIAMAPSDKYRGYYCGMMAVETAITSKYLSAEQAWEIVKMFPEEEDGIRVEMAMVLFSRVVDLENFGSEIVDKLTELEQRELNWRVGTSNLFNGVDIDRKYWIDLTCYDEREIFKKLIKLSLLEPNAMKFTHTEYRREWKTEVVPGLGVNEKWLEDVDNVPTDMGELCFVYKTGGKTHMNGFYESNANVEARKELKGTCFVGSKTVF
ncbi:hypothetical protein TrST_g12153 [Triparma strigata]|uniref:EF-hand domain-containing protein n=1 Tax=Triparma strigata TaxID=1606541 RepID=A0A9W7EIF6_9STRA|nr:hypothetical protein TrST_g12153 [Triparma strigata]